MNEFLLLLTIRHHAEAHRKLLVEMASKLKIETDRDIVLTRAGAMTDLVTVLEDVETQLRRQQGANESSS